MMSDNMTLETAGRDQRARGLTIAQGVLAALSFSLLLAGTNATTPLLPLYQRALHFSPLMMSLTFVCYVSVLIGVLIFCSRPKVAKWSAPLLCVALVVFAVADGFLATATQSGILIGRVIAGIAVGAGTGAAAALVVSSYGAQGRAISATGNLIGAVAGTVFAQVCVLLLDESAMRWTFLIHGAACLLLFACLAVVLWMRVKASRLRFAEGHSAASRGGDVLKCNARPVVIGCVAWMLASAAIVTLPAFYAALGMSWISAFGIIILLIFSAVSQIASPWLCRVAPWISGLGAMVAGSTLLLAGATFNSTAIAALGFVLIGTGIGVSYRLCLLVVTKGATPEQQSRLSSLYAAVTYTAAASCVLALGFLGNAIGLHRTVMCVFILLTGTLLALARHAPKLINARE